MRLLNYLNEKADEPRYYAEVRVFEDGEDYINVSTTGNTEQEALKDAREWAKELGGKIKIVVFDTQHPQHGHWSIHVETKTYK